MALSPAKQHFLRVKSADEATKRAGDETRPDATVYEQFLAKLHQDRLRLKQVQSNEAKAALKAELVPEYAAYVEGVLAADAGAPDEVITTVMVWAIDASMYRSALDLAAYVLKHKLAMPDRFERTTGCLVAEEIAEGAKKALDAGEEFPIDVLEQATDLTAAEDMPDEVRAKLYLMRGRAVIRNVNDDAPPPVDVLEAAVAHLKRAIELHGACGGKKDLERAERLLKKQTAAATPAAAQGTEAPKEGDTGKPDASEGDGASAGG